MSVGVKKRFVLHVPLDKTEIQTATDAAADDKKTNAEERVTCFPRIMRRLAGCMPTASKGAASCNRISTSASSKLENLQAGLHAKQTSLEEAYSNLQCQALVAHKAGKREDAMRFMKKAARAREQARRHEAAFEAIERQKQVLHETEMQRDISVALKHSAAAIKKAVGRLSVKTVEKVADQMEDGMEMANDIDAAMQQMISTGTADQDEDALQAELDAMVDDDTEVHAVSEAQARTDEPPTVYLPREAFPAAPKNADKQRLLAGQERSEVAVGA